MRDFCSDGHRQASDSDLETWLCYVENVRTWLDLGLLIGECPCCKSTLARQDQESGPEES